LKLVSWARIVPVKLAGFGGEVKVGNPEEKPIALGDSPERVAHAAVAKVQLPPNANWSDSA